MPPHPLHLQLAARCRRLAFVSLVIVTAFLTGCGRNTPKAQFTFVSNGGHNNFDPQGMSWMQDIRLANCLYVGLVRYDFSSHKVTSGVASSWSVAPDGLTYTFHLRKDAKWSNGDPVTARDFLYAWRRAMLPDNAAQYSHLFWDIKGAKAFYDWRTRQLDAYAKSATHTQAAAQKLWQQAVQHFNKTVGIAAPDSHTIIVHLIHPQTYFLELVAFVTYVPVDAGQMEKSVTLNPATGMRELSPGYFSHPDTAVSNGPYVLSEYVPQQYVFLKANKNYWARASMQNDSILERIITDTGNALLTYRNGYADWLPDIPTASQTAANLVAQHRRDVHLQKAAGTYFYNYNCLPTLATGKKNPLADWRVRRALSMAIDRKKIVDKVTGLKQPIGKSFIPVGVIQGYHPPVKDAVLYDPVAARKLLAEAGYPGGKGLTDLSIMYNTNGGHAKIAQAIASMWAQTLGVHVNLDREPRKAFSAKLRQHAFTIARASWFGDYPDPTTWLDKMRTGDGNNDCGWSNAAYDKLLNQARGMNDKAKRFALLAQAEDIIQKRQPMALLFQYDLLNVYDPAKVRNLNPNPWARWNLENVRVTPHP